MNFRGFPPGCGDSVADFWGWDAHEARLRCPDDVSGDMQEDEIPVRALSLNLLPTHGRTGNRTRDLKNSSQKLWPLDHEAGPKTKTFSTDSAYPMQQQKTFFISFGTTTTAASIWTVATPSFDRDSLWFFNRLIFIKLSKHVTTMKWVTFFSLLFPHNENEDCGRWTLWSGYNTI
jgi:hypothetical protein